MKHLLLITKLYTNFVMQSMGMYYQYMSDLALLFELTSKFQDEEKYMESIGYEGFELPTIY